MVRPAQVGLGHEVGGLEIRLGISLMGLEAQSQKAMCNPGASAAGGGLADKAGIVRGEVGYQV